MVKIKPGTKIYYTYEHTAFDFVEFKKDSAVLTGACAHPTEVALEKFPLVSVLDVNTNKHLCTLEEYAKSLNEVLLNSNEENTCTIRIGFQSVDGKLRNTSEVTIPLDNVAEIISAVKTLRKFFTVSLNIKY